jgi:hypothetical protein
MRKNSPLIVCLVDSSRFCHVLTTHLLVCDSGKAEGALLRVSLSGHWSPVDSGVMDPQGDFCHLDYNGDNQDH